MGVMDRKEGMERSGFIHQNKGGSWVAAPSPEDPGKAAGVSPYEAMPKAAFVPGRRQ
jgi:hypothetical protein